MNRPLRFVLVTTFYPPYSFGGDAIHVETLARALASAGHRVDVIHCVDSYRLLRSAGPREIPDDSPGVSVHRLRSRFGVASPVLSQQTGRPWLKAGAILEILNRSRPDVIHYHNISLFGPEVMRLSADRNPAVKLYTMHEYWLVCPTHVLWKYNRRACDRQECLRCTLRSGRPPQVWRYTGMLERCTEAIDAFLAPSRFSAEMHARYGFTRPTTLFPLFVEPSAAQRQDLAPPHPRPYFLFVGRLEAVKNPGSLIDAWAKVAGADLLLAGTGSELPQLKARAAADPRIRFLGHVDQASLGPLYAHCLACVVPSSMYETFPLVVLEAYTRRAPVVARDHGALTEMVGQSGGGLLYRTEEELLAALARIARDAGLRAELGANGQRMVTGAWSKEAHLDRYFGLLRTVASRRFGAVPWEAAEAEPIAQADRH
jgi:glycosyltransferase involved in cell wall biosynthesis